MNTILSRREFGAAAATSIALTIAPDYARALSVEPKRVRYIHVELGIGPWSRDEISEVLLDLSAQLHLTQPTRVSTLGADANAKIFPERFVLTLHYPDAVRLVLRASKTHSGPARALIRYADETSMELQGRVPRSPA